MLEKLLEALIGLTTALNAHTAALSADAPKATKGKAAKETTAVVATTTTPIAATAATGQIVAIAAPPSRESIVPVFQEVANKVSRDAAVAILEKYGVKNFSGVKPEQYAAFLADCQAALNPPAAADNGLI